MKGINSVKTICAIPICNGIYYLKVAAITTWSRDDINHIIRIVPRKHCGIRTGATINNVVTSTTSDGVITTITINFIIAAAAVKNFGIPATAYDIC